MKKLGNHQNNENTIQACCLLPAVCCLLSAACCLLPAPCCVLPASCCLLSAACCLMPAACWTKVRYFSVLPLLLATFIE
jgi:hypothetical protein